MKDLGLFIQAGGSREQSIIELTHIGTTTTAIGLVWRGDQEIQLLTVNATTFIGLA